ncbi:MAG: hypothetical protein WCC12_00295 [Anaerolineales bacterium]
MDAPVAALFTGHGISVGRFYFSTRKEEVLCQHKLPKSFKQPELYLPAHYKVGVYRKASFIHVP